MSSWFWWSWMAVLGWWLRLTDRFVVPVYAILAVLAPLSLTEWGWWKRLASHGKTLEEAAARGGGDSGGAAIVTSKNKERGGTNNNGTSAGCVPVAFSIKLRDELFRPDGRLYVSKRWFAHFYVAGLVQLGLIIVSLGGLSGSFVSCANHRNVDERFLLVLVTAHLIRRWMECHHVHSWNSKNHDHHQQQCHRRSRMHVAGYLLGIVHYLLLPLALWPLPSLSTLNPGGGEEEALASGSSDPGTTAVSHHEQGLLGLWWVLRWLARIGCVSLGVWAQCQQHRHHVLLARVRLLASDKNNSSNRHYYGIPMGGWFRYVSCPHYLAEILIYVSFVSLSVLSSLEDSDPTNNNDKDSVATRTAAWQTTRWTRSCVVLVWVIDNLLVSALRSHRWYMERFPTEYPKLNRRAIVPFLL